MSTSALAQKIEDDGTGTAHPDAVYVAVQIIMSPDDATGSVTWRPWHSSAARAAKEEPLFQCQHITVLNAADFAACAAYGVSAGPFTAAVDQALAFVATTVADVDSGQKDASGNPVMVPFFAGAKPVTLDV